MEFYLMQSCVCKEPDQTCNLQMQPHGCLLSECIEESQAKAFNLEGFRTYGLPSAGCQERGDNETSESGWTCRHLGGRTALRSRWAASEARARHGPATRCTRGIAPASVTWMSSGLPISTTLVTSGFAGCPVALGPVLPSPACHCFQDHKC